MRSISLRTGAWGTIAGLTGPRALPHAGDGPVSIRKMGSSDLVVWMTRTELACEPDLLARYVALLSAEERVRWAAFRSEAARHRFLLGRALVRVALSETTGDPPERWQFAIERFGRPVVAHDSRDLRFNLSHTDGLVACVVAVGRDVGIDVERLDTSTPVIDLARRFLPAEEAQAVVDARPEHRHACFLERWTLHEALAKALGTGLGAPRPDRDGSDQWRFWLRHPTPEHTLAVAASVTDDRLAHPSLRHVVPLAA